MKSTGRIATAADYEAIFAREQAQSYPMVDALEERTGYALPTAQLLEAARVLACPVKTAPPNWQHGRVIYALTRAYATTRRAEGSGALTALDIGTAKGFSALCLYWGITDAGLDAAVTSVDVLDPMARCRRNTIAEVDGYQTLAEILRPWPEARSITFERFEGQKWLTKHVARLHVAFVDGKHAYDAVSWEALLLADRQRSGDLAIFDDVQIAGVAKALTEARCYDFEYLQVLPDRMYAIGVRR